MHRRPKLPAPVAPSAKVGVAVAPTRPAATDAPSISAASQQIESDLREQNDYFARAFAAKRRGATTEAIEGFESFVARYPSSPLVENALVQRMRLLRGVDPARAARAAAQYLADYPKGFARGRLLDRR